MTTVDGPGVHERRRRLAGVSLALAEEGRRVAFEGDRWFLLAVGGAGRCVTWIRRGLRVVGHGVLAPPRRLGAAWSERNSPSARLRRLLKRQARVSGVDLRAEALDAFSSQLAVLVDLVTTGAIDVRDITFEATDDAPAEAIAREPLDPANPPGPLHSNSAKK